MKSLMTLVSAILQDCSLACNTSIERDLITIRSRVEHEGLSFLTITLPMFGNQFLQGLETKHFDVTTLTGFKKSAKGHFPAFLQGFVSLVFDTNGRLHNDPDLQAIDCIHQVCSLFKKIEIPCTEARQRKAIEAFEQCEIELRSRDVVLSTTEPNFKREFSLVAGIAFGGWMHDLDFALQSGSMHLQPKHGPGSTASKLRGNSKFKSLSWTRRLQRYFPIDHYLFFNYEDWIESVRNDLIPDLLRKCDEDPVRVVLVPKTLKSPRVIALEPVHMQYVQQSMMKIFVNEIEASPFTRGHLNFTDQTINGTHAKSSSRSGKLATLDLSEASDRVSATLASFLFCRYDALRKAVFSCRSTHATLPTGGKILLKKFASMGSALCFPIESMVFFTIAVLNGIKQRGLPVNPDSYNEVVKSVYIYGDDILVPGDEVKSLSQVLHTVGLKVNAKKTFYRGKFRESCGVDAYDGLAITPIRIKHQLPERRNDHEQIESTVALANGLYKRGYWRAASYLRHHVERILGRNLPHVAERAGHAGWHSYLGTRTVERWNESYQRMEVRVTKTRMSHYPDALVGYEALRKWGLSVDNYQGHRPWRISRETYQLKDGQPNGSSFERLLDPLRSDTRVNVHSSERRDASFTKRHWVPAY